jgi:hypothetical protein
MNRPVSLIGGLVVLVLGAIVLVRGANFSTRRDVLRVGEVKLTAEEQRSVPPWAGGVAVAIGTALLVTGARRRS